MHRSKFLLASNRFIFANSRFWRFIHDVQSSEPFKGDTIKILAGPEKQSLLIHQEALSLSGSASLQALVNGKWGESENRIIDWGHTDVDTVTRVCTFLYTGDYHTPRPTPRVEVSPPVPKEEVKGDEIKIDIRHDTLDGSGPAAEVAHEFELTTAPSEPEPTQEVALAEEVLPAQNDLKESETNLQNALLQSSNARPLTPIVAITVSEVALETSTEFDVTEYPYVRHSYADVLLAHAKLYAFAKYHFYPALANLAFRRLVKTLDNVQCEEEHAACEIAALADYVYEHVAQDCADEEPLRKTVTHFVAINFTSLERGDVAKSLAVGGDFTLDVLRKVSRRLRAEGELVNALQQENARLKQTAHGSPTDEEQPADPWGYDSGRRRRKKNRGL